MQRKKILVYLVIIALLLSVVSCGKGNVDEASSDTNQNTDQQGTNDQASGSTQNTGETQQSGDAQQPGQTTGDTQQSADGTVAGAQPADAAQQADGTQSADGTTAAAGQAAGTTGSTTGTTGSKTTGTTGSKTTTGTTGSKTTTGTTTGSKTATGSTGTAKPAGFVPAKATGTVKIWFGKPTMQQAWIDQMNDWPKTYPGSKLVWEVLDRKSFIPTVMSKLAAGDTADIVPLDYGVHYPLWAIRDVVQPVDKYVDMTEWPKNAMDSFKWRGKYYGVSSGTGIYAILYDKSQFDNAGMDDPFTLWKQGKWTWDAFRETGMALTYDSDGDGKTDQWGFADVRNQSLNHLVASNGGELIKVKSDGTLVSNLKDPKVLQAMEFFLDMYQVSKYALPAFGVVNRQPFLDGKIGMLYEVDPPGTQGPGMEYHAVLWPTGPSLPAGQVPKIGSAGAWGILKVSKNPQGAAEYFRWEQEWNRIQDEKAKAAVTPEQEAANKKESRAKYGFFWEELEILGEAQYPVSVDNAIPGIQPLFNQMRDEIWKDGKTPSSVLAEKIPQFDAAIKDVMAGKVGDEILNPPKPTTPAK